MSYSDIEDSFKRAVKKALIEILEEENEEICWSSNLSEAITEAVRLNKPDEDNEA